MRAIHVQVAGSGRRPLRSLVIFALCLGLSALSGQGSPVPVRQGSTAQGASPLRCDVSWVGNSLSGRKGWVLQDVAGITVLPDGTLFTNVYWDEGGANVEEYRRGALLDRAGHTHGWGYEGGDDVAANARYLFIVQNVDNEGGGLVGTSWPPKGFTWSGISRRLRSNIRQGAPFANGRGKEGDVLPGSFLPMVQVPNGQAGASAASLPTRSISSSAVPGITPCGSTARNRWILSGPGTSSDRTGWRWIATIASECCSGRCKRKAGGFSPRRTAANRFRRD